ncbi:MAG: hypothetical protein VKK04_20705 [Synechococcales bacterium]|nr:hypothetical protein [Synechococcales bacterium]
MNSEHTDIPSPENLDSNRISLPEPDAENITVLTKALPNEPILPWHRFDSPWLNMQSPEVEADGAANGADTPGEAMQPDGLYDPEEAAQLSLFAQPSEPALAEDPPATSHNDPKNNSDAAEAADTAEAADAAIATPPAAAPDSPAAVDPPISLSVAHKPAVSTTAASPVNSSES